MSSSSTTTNNNSINNNNSLFSMCKATGPKYKKI